MASKPFYGWWIVAAMIPANLVHAGALFYIFGIFYGPLHEAFGWARFQVATGITICMLALGLSAPLIGKLTDRFGPKTVIWTGAFLGGIGFFVMSLIQELWQFYLLYFVLGIGFSACGVIPISTAVTSWFDKKRGMAMGLTMAGVSFGAITITPIGGIILQAFGWRAAYVFLGLCSWLLVIPPIFFLFKNTPQEKGLLPDGKKPDPERPDPDQTKGPILPEGLSFQEALSTSSLWLVFSGYVLVFLTVGVVLGHQIVFLTDMGISMSAAALALGVTGGMGGLGKIVFGFLADRFSPQGVAIFCVSTQAVGIFLLFFAKTMPIIWIFTFVFGFSMGGQLALEPLIVGYLFGQRSFGSIYGLIAMAGALGTAIGPVAAGKIYDLLGSYHWAFAGCIGACALAAAAFICSRRMIPAQQNPF